MMNDIQITMSLINFLAPLQFRHFCSSTLCQVNKIISQSGKKTQLQFQVKHIKE